MSLSAQLTPHEVTLLRASVTIDRKQVAQEDWTAPSSRVRSGFVQPRGSSETHEPTGSRVRSTHVLFCAEPDLTAKDRVLWSGRTYLIVGTPSAHETPAGYHHSEADLIVVEG